MPATSSRPCRLSPPAIVCPLGHELDQVADGLFAGRPGLVEEAELIPGRRVPVGRVESELPCAQDWPIGLRTRNNLLLAMALERLNPELEALRERIPEARIAVVLGTSTSSIAEGERAVMQRGRDGTWPPDFRYATFELGSVSRFALDHLGLDGPGYTISTACTSSAKALSSARRLLASGYDAVIAGGVDTLCGLTLNGFSSLEVISDRPCLPFSANRTGVNIGEAAALFLVTAEAGGIQLSGYGESSDAHHISAPCPDGRGAERAMRDALEMASLSPEQIDYLNLHGTATLQNDAMESIAVQRVFGSELPCSSTKALTGHTLGACGALEAAFCWLSLHHARMPPHRFDGKIDPSLPALNLTAGGAFEGRRVMSNSFGFGGNNISLIMERSDVA
ncbi:beta-ketoacyl-[acyl-carrier-protein] synthase family protein [Halotalea alkalilenta]|uniref:Beta-ketoacyl-[acyl-carrier-protein] synthase II n=1 Tax=Halotalea alkalilenta TaxID=376489 RepID=A0A172YDI5_9GAMM|nr:beta-ketoacyl-[acyl-carrier-protein] synthase family protein [Halotalea alkalilenta]ANF57045.1 beta-ketoacyl-[acyl-carrier-protein] synthase II [Halotalea alkalilenta]